MVRIIRVRVSQLVGGDGGERCKGEEESVREIKRERDRGKMEREAAGDLGTVSQVLCVCVCVFSAQK